MFTGAQDWLARLKEAGGTIEIDDVTMYPREPSVSFECETIWNEIRGRDNMAKWRQVEELVRSKVGPIVGWANF
jgi:hypothetical protein